MAEEAGVDLALHPDDPPVDSVRGVPRLVNSVENVQRILDLHDSPNHGLTFCQGNYAAMGADIPETIRRFGDRIHFVHFRDVDGTPESFVETWQDDGPTDMLAAIEAYREAGFDGPIRPITSRGCSTKTTATRRRRATPTWVGCSRSGI